MAFASAGVGLIRAVAARQAGEWVHAGDGHLLWETWAADPGSRRLLHAALLALGIWVALRFFRDAAWTRVVSRFIDRATRRRPLAILIAIALFPQAVAPMLRPNTDGKPNVVVILLDTVRLDHVGWGGSDLPTTPRLDKLAKSGATFTQTIAQAPWTKPSTASLLTGLTPQHHLAVSRPPYPGGQFLDASKRTLADAYASAGYRTVGISSNPNVSSAFGFQQGFQKFTENTRMNADDALERADEHLKGQGDQPYFLYLHLNDAHYPYEAPWPFGGMFVGGRVAPRLDGPTERRFRSGHTSFSPEQVEAMRRAWAEEIRYLDDRVGQWVNRQLMLDPNLLVVILSDHGEEFLDHGDLGHGHSLHEELIRVPLQFSWGRNLKLKADSFSQQIRVMDVAPTLLELCGLPWPPQVQAMDGLSFANALLDEQPLEARAAPMSSESRGSLRSGRLGPLRGIREPHGKWIETGEAYAGHAQGWSYDLLADPNETTNLATQNPANDHDWRLKLRSLGWYEPVWQPTQEEAAVTNPSLLRDLEALGYLEHTEDPSTGEWAEGAVPGQAVPNLQN